MKSAFEENRHGAFAAILSLALVALVASVAPVVFLSLTGAAPSVGSGAAPGAAWGGVLDLGTSAATCVVDADGTPVTFGWDTLVYVASPVEGTLCWVQLDGLDIGDQDSAAATTIDDAGGAYPDGFGACFGVTKGAIVDDSPREVMVRARAGASPGVCASAAATVIDSAVYPPCRANGDCTDLGAGSSCDLTPEDATHSSGALLCGRGRQAGRAIVSVRK